MFIHPYTRRCPLLTDIYPIPLCLPPVCFMYEYLHHYMFVKYKFYSFNFLQSMSCVNGLCIIMYCPVCLNRSPVTGLFAATVFANFSWFCDLDF